MPDVKVGDRTLTVQPFNAYKALEAGELVGRITESVPELSTAAAEFAAKYRADNTGRLARAAAEFRYPAEAGAVSDAAWEASGQELAFPEEPRQELVWAAVFKKTLTVARDPVMDLLALCITPNSEIEQADADGNDPAEVSKQYRRLLLHQAKLPQLILVFKAAIEATSQEFADEGVEADLGNLLGTLGIRLPGVESPSQPQTRARRSSNGSRSASDGRGAKSSSKSRGASSAASAGG